MPIKVKGNSRWELVPSQMPKTKKQPLEQAVPPNVYKLMYIN